MQSFDPRVRRLNPEPPPEPVEEGLPSWPAFEVFHQEKRGARHEHVGSLHAPNPEMALVFAKEQFGRRKKCVSIWVVPSDRILASAEQDEDMFANNLDKTYRDASGFRVMEKINRIRREQGNNQTGSKPK